MTELGTRIPQEELQDEFPSDEGSINLIYGMIGNGKTYAATADILERLKWGSVEYANWHIITEDYDQRKDFGHVAVKTFTWQGKFYKIPQSKNLHYFNLASNEPLELSRCPACGDHHIFERIQDLIAWLSGLVDCTINFDEGQDIFDSYEGTDFSKNKRRLLLHTRHYHRTINIITQRPTAIQVSARGNVNRFYKCVKVGSWPVPRFVRYEFQEMTKETVDEEAEPISVKSYWGKQKIFNAYNTDYLRGGIVKSQDVHFEAWRLSLKHKIIALGRIVRGIWQPKERATAPSVSDNPPF